MKIEAIKKIQIELILEMENIEKRTGTTYASITNITREIKEIVSGAYDDVEDIDTSAKEQLKSLIQTT